MIILSLVFTTCVPLLFSIGAYEHYAGRKGGLYFAAAMFCLVSAVACAWAYGKGLTL